MQTSYSTDPLIGSNGTLVDGSPAEIDSLTAEGALKCGCFVVVGATARSVKHPSATWASNPERVIGFVMADPARTTPDYADKELAPVARFGDIWVTFEPDTTPTVDTPVFARITANGAGKLQLGAPRANADTANAIQVPGAYWRQISGTVGRIDFRKA